MLSQIKECLFVALFRHGYPDSAAFASQKSLQQFLLIGLFVYQYLRRHHRPLTVILFDKFCRHFFSGVSLTGLNLESLASAQLTAPHREQHYEGIIVVLDRKNYIQICIADHGHTLGFRQRLKRKDVISPFGRLLIVEGF